LSGTLARLRALISSRIPSNTNKLSKPTRRSRVRIAAHVAAHLATVALLLSVPAVAFADPGTGYLAAKSLPEVISGIQRWVMGILAAVATLFLVLAGVYYATAGGDPAQVDKAKGAMKNALVGYGLAVLAPVLLQVVQGIVGAP
jgi:hypothetical protein